MPTYKDMGPGLVSPDGRGFFSYHSASLPFPPPSISLGNLSLPSCVPSANMRWFLTPNQLSQSAQAAVTNSTDQATGPTGIYLLILVPGAESPRSASWVPDEVSLPGMQRVPFSPCPHMEHTRRKARAVLPLLIRTLIPPQGPPAPGPHITLLSSQKPCLLTPCHWGLGF